VARTPGYGSNSVLYFPTRDVAAKTGTTNDSRDAWTVGYTPNLVVGVWAGNNDNSPMVKKVAGQIVAPMWSSFMKQGLAVISDERFIPPTEIDKTALKPVLKGIWQGGKTYTIDTVSGKIATEFTPEETRKEIPVTSVHSILYWLSKSDPFGPQPTDPTKDQQFERWEAPVRKWAEENGYTDQTDSVIPTLVDDIHTQANTLQPRVQNINTSEVYGLNDTISFSIASSGRYPLSKASLYINDVFIETKESQPFTFRFTPKEIPGIKEKNQMRIMASDSVFNKNETRIEFSVALDN
jgi:penicillin-binding protein 1A